MNKIKKGFINKLSKMSDNFSKDFAEVAVNISLEKDLYNKNKEYRSVVDELFPGYLENYVKCCEYLYNDFGVKSAKINNEDTDIIKEIGLREQVESILKEKIDRGAVNRLRLIIKKTKSIFQYNKQIKKWWILSTILENYPDVLRILKKLAGANIYKEIDIIEEVANVKRDSYLIEDFSLREKN